MRRLLFLFLLLSTTGSAQQVDYFGGMDLRDGIYRDFQAFQTNRPTAPLSALRDAQGLPVTDIRRTRGTLSWQPDTGAEQTIDLSRIWGFCQNDVVYIATGNGFYRIGLMGGLSHLVVQETYRDWDPYMYGYPYGGVTRTVLVQQLLDMETGYFLPFNAAGMDKALLHDPVLSEEFRGLSKKQRNRTETLFRFLRMYNDRHPLSFPE
ncbi:MAG: hypothetical protein IPH05_02720 [Flavobacteriales bacterium]|jgi:hypothetical protein|nr:hypothetical protein [Flavobacteriales bacterium]MBK6881862.1 hypothetical protein [Flavobacteriales bacterium]MBK7102484.1 hypothetical protein [Flavobacteriales bacterium]MBK7113219.1 hypothetical protein [Flavobacteriales bacterium]MBK7482781.1 hypothetical protein [Flavobacteriales bacterium]